MAATHEDVEELELQLAQVDGALQDAPDLADLITLRNELVELIALTRKQVPSTSDARSARNRGDDRLDSEVGALFRPKVGDVVRAKWITGDHQFYSAAIVAQTGDPAEPLYTVKFSDYEERCTVKAHQVKPLHEQRAKVQMKLSSQARPAVPSSTTPAAAAALPPKSVRAASTKEEGARHQQARPLDAPPQPAAAASKKKHPQPGNKLDKSKASWQAFASSNAKTRAATMSVSVPVGMKDRPVALPDLSLKNGGMQMHESKRRIASRSPSPGHAQHVRRRSRSPPRHAQTRDRDRDRTEDQRRRRDYDDRDYRRR